MVPFFDPVDPASDQARRLLEHELSRGRYSQRASLIDRAAQWLADLWHRYLDVSIGAGAPVALLVVVGAFVIALLVWILPKVRRERRGQRGAGVIEDPAATPTDYRARASRALGEGRLDDALLDTFRAVAAEATERTLLDDAPGQTAHEISLALAPSFLDQQTALRTAADRFDAVRYGNGRATRPEVDEMVALDRTLSRGRPAHQLLEPPLAHS